MRPDGLTHADYRLWLDAQTATHQQRVRVRVRDLDHRLVGDLSHLFVDGDVNFDVSRDVTRKLSLTLTDPSRSIGWEPDTVTGAPRYGNRMIQVDVLTRVSELGDWVECPVFTGPVVDFDRQGAEVNISCDGKERLALGSFPTPITFRRKTKVTWCIFKMLTLTGETRLGQLPNLNATLPEDITCTRTDSPWVQAQELARSIDRVLFYDARGHLRLVRRPPNPVVTVRSEWLTEPVSLDRQDVSETPNRWLVLGPKPKGGKRRISVNIQMPKSSPLSLERDGKRIWRTERIERNGIKTHRKARDIGQHHRDEALRNRTDFTVSCLNLPHLSEWDLVRVRDPYVGAFWLRLDKATIPLDGSPMTLGDTRRRRTTNKKPRQKAA